MSGAVPISRQAGQDLKVFAEFFGIDLAWNDHIFRYVARSDSRAFEAFLRLAAEGCQQDVRFGIGDRIRQDAARGKGRK